MFDNSTLPVHVLDILPNPVLVKNARLEYVWVNSAFTRLFNLQLDEVVGRMDKELFPDRQVAQCSGGDLRVLDSGEIDEAVETVFTDTGEPRQTITRKDRLTTSTGEHYLVGVIHDITDVTLANENLKAANERLGKQALELEAIARTDVLTQCLNRRALKHCEAELFSPRDRGACLLLLDIDHFKRINDRHGHECGDLVLKQFAATVRSALPNSAYFIRLGGEEFAVCLPAKTAADSLRVAGELRALIQDSTQILNGQRIDYTVSIGASHKPTGCSVSIDEILLQADDRLYAAKNAGRNRVVATG